MHEMMNSTWAYIASGTVGLVILSLAFQNGRMWRVLPEVLSDAWQFSRRIKTLSFAMTSLFATWYLWNGEVDFPKLKGIYVIFAVISAGTWIYFVYLEMQSISWETLLRESLCVMSWDTRMATLNPKQVDEVLTFLMANDDFLRVLMQVPDEERKEMLRTASIDFRRHGFKKAKAVAGGKERRE